MLAINLRAERTSANHFQNKQTKNQQSYSKLEINTKKVFFPFCLKGNFSFKAEMNNIKNHLGPGFFNHKACLFGSFSSYSPQAA